MKVDEIRFNESNILPIFTSPNWELINSEISNNTLVIHPNGKAKCVPTQTIVNRTFMYYMISINFVSESISSISNFKNIPYCFITETYKNENNELYKNRSRALGFNTFNPVSGVESNYIDTTIFSSLNKPLGYYEITIVNNSETDLIINSIGVFSSIDVSGDQVGDVINTINAETEPNGFKVYVDPSYQNLLGLSVMLRNSDRELKYKPIYSEGLLSSIETNFGISYPIVYTTDEIDLST